MYRYLNTTQLRVGAFAEVAILRPDIDDIIIVRSSVYMVNIPEVADGFKGYSIAIS